MASLWAFPTVPACAALVHSPRWLHAGGLEAPVGLGSGELRALGEERSGVEVAVRCAQRVAGIDDIGHTGGGAVDHPAELFDTFDELRHHVRLDVGRLDRAGERSHGHPPRVEVLDAADGS